ncbi:DUF2637 domain-containing protein [Streptomyces sp. Wh19]|uniref:DUF2637 domain-containing protein n=1 Tax=Streptomyces sp. Wh19 TaxID=3076629 RepID=UPI0029584A06|nr:DUF2637 domain-containing protein [Streptomyces sp. Wh19]MDV9195528.1 DUF2637 domain-containing protein [Streptomyces sp. Wh19]
MSYREEKRADDAARRAQDREDRRLDLDARLKSQEIAAEQKRQDAELKAEQSRKDAEARRRQELAERRARQQEKVRRRATRAAKVGRAARWLNQNPVTVFVGFVMVSAIVPAVISQVGALEDAGVDVLLAAMLAAMLEGGAWALTFMGKAAEDRGEPTAKYRVATWLTAAVAAGVNYWHWMHALPDQMWVAVVFAASSLFAILLWDMKTHRGHGRTKAQRREARARSRHLKRRRKDHKAIAKEADRLLSAMPYGSLDDEAAFAATWTIHTGAEPGMTPELFQRATQAQLALGKALEVAEDERPTLIRAGLHGALASPFRTPIGRGVPTLPALPSTPTAEKPAEVPTAQFPQGKQPVRAGAENGPEKLTETDADTSWERHLDRARDAATDLVAEGKTISATSLAKILKIRREDAMKLRDRIVAERRLRVA